LIYGISIEMTGLQPVPLANLRPGSSAKGSHERNPRTALCPSMTIR
jgi:hypothetical protein